MKITAYKVWIMQLTQSKNGMGNVKNKRCNRASERVGPNWEWRENKGRVKKVTLKERTCFLGAKARVGGGGGAGEEKARGEKRVLEGKREEEEEGNRNCNRRRWRCAIDRLWEWRALLQQHHMKKEGRRDTIEQHKSMVFPHSSFLSMHFLILLKFRKKN